MTEYVDENPKDLYTANYFQKTEETGTGYTNYLNSPAANVIGKYAFARLFGDSSGKHLDLGCADGSLIELFDSDGFDSRGVDISADMVRVIQEKGLYAEQSNLTNLSANLLDNVYITAFDVFEHSDKPGIAINEAKKALAEDGYLVFSTLSVKALKPTEYWFNHSLEHYAYYTKESLERILTDIFGVKNFAFIEIEINGVSEFWGIASKQAIKAGDKKLLSSIEKDKRINDAARSYYLSLFYNQVARFTQGRSVIEKYGSSWTAAERVRANFYNYFFEGRLELAINTSVEDIHNVPISSAAFWQAYAFSQAQLSEVQKQSILKESADQILELRSDLFKTRDELHALHNSRFIGRIIKARDKIGDATPKIKHLPRRSVVAVKVRVARYLPGWFRRPVMKVLRYRPPAREVRVKTVQNKPWPIETPLVSIVVPYYNRADVIDDTLYSLSQQTFPNLEIIIVNDGSSDKQSSRKFKQLQKDGYPAVFVDQENQGVAAARNNGIRLARGKYIVCLDSDDILDPTYIEKAVTVLETNPNVSIVSSYMKVFGVVEEEFRHAEFNPLGIYKNNMIITAAMFTKEAWQISGGYKSNIGYEDWEFWINLVEHGFWAAQIPESLFIYRTSMQSRYVEDKDIHWNNLKVIRSLHPDFKQKVRAHLRERGLTNLIIDSTTATVNLFTKPLSMESRSANILITVPWMTFGGAETLIYNFCREIKDDYNITFVTGIKSENEWEYKFKEITASIFHLPNILPTETLYERYVAGLIKERNIDTLHIIHNGFTFAMLENLKKEFPNLRVILTLFNDRAAYFEQSLGVSKYIDTFTSDNGSVINHYKKVLSRSADLRVIPNGINCVTEFNPQVQDRKLVRKELGIANEEKAVFFIGRLSEEKNPDVVVDAAAMLLGEQKIASKLKFFIIGDGPMRSTIEKSLEEVDNPRIVYLGYQSKIAHYLSAADIFVLPSSIEGFPLSILEAMAMSVVPIASRVGAVPEVIEDGKNGYVVKPGSVEEITQAIKKLLSDQTLLKNMKKDAREKVESQYSNPVLGKNYRKLYGVKSK